MSAPRWLRASNGAAFVALLALVAGCGGTASAPTVDPATDKLAQIQARGTLVGYAELDYPPQSIRVDGAARATETKCEPNQMTSQEVTGFDVETTKLVAKALDVEACFVSPTFTEVDFHPLRTRYAGGFISKFQRAGPPLLFGTSTSSHECGFAHLNCLTVPSTVTVFVRSTPAPE